MSADKATLNPGALFVARDDGRLWMCVNHTPGVGITAISIIHHEDRRLVPSGTGIAPIAYLEEMATKLLARLTCSI